MSCEGQALGCYPVVPVSARGFMAVSLTKIIDGNPAISDALMNALTVHCPRCEQSYRLGYSNEEWHRLRTWQELAGKALREDHDLRHEAATIPLEWRGIRRR